MTWKQNLKRYRWIHLFIPWGIIYDSSQNCVQLHQDSLNSLRKKRVIRQTAAARSEYPADIEWTRRWNGKESCCWLLSLELQLKADLIEVLASQSFNFFLRHFGMSLAVNYIVNTVSRCYYWAKYLAVGYHRKRFRWMCRGYRLLSMTLRVTIRQEKRLWRRSMSQAGMSSVFVLFSWHSLEVLSHTEKSDDSDAS